MNTVKDIVNYMNVIGFASNGHKIEIKEHDDNIIAEDADGNLVFYFNPSTELPFWSGTTLMTLKVIKPGKSLSIDASSWVPAPLRDRLISAIAAMHTKDHEWVKPVHVAVNNWTLQDYQTQSLGANLMDATFEFNDTMVGKKYTVYVSFLESSAHVVIDLGPGQVTEVAFTAAEDPTEYAELYELVERRVSSAKRLADLEVASKDLDTAPSKYSSVVNELKSIII